MPQNIYTIELDGKEYDIEGDREPTEAEVRALIGASDSPHPPTEAERQQNMAAQAHINTDPDKAYNASLDDTISKTVGGVVRGAASVFDPRTYIETAKAVGDAVFPTSPEAVERTGQRVRGMAQMVGKVVSGDPEAGGEAIGQLATGALVPRIAPMVPGGLVRAGNLTTKAGEAVANTHIASPIGIAEVIAHGDIGRGAMIAGAPYILKGAGRVMSKAGELMGGKTPSIASPNAGGRLVKPAPASDPLVDAVNSVRQPEPTPSASLPPARTMTPAGSPALSAAEYDALLRSAQRPAAAVSPIEAQALQTQAPSGSDILNSPIAQQLLASLEERGATPGKVDVAEIPKSRSSGIQGEGSAPSATPGLTRNDMMAAGLNPDVRITKLTPDMRDRILQSRAARRSTYAEEAAMRRRLDALVDKDK